MDCVIHHHIIITASNYARKNQLRRREQFFSHIPWLQVRFVTKFYITKIIIPPFISWLATGTQGKGVGEVQGTVIPEMLPVIRLMVYGRVKLQWKLHMKTNRTD